MTLLFSVFDLDHDGEWDKSRVENPGRARCLFSIEGARKNMLLSHSLSWSKSQTEKSMFVLAPSIEKRHLAHPRFSTLLLSHSKSWSKSETEKSKVCPTLVLRAEWGNKTAPSFSRFSDKKSSHPTGDMGLKTPEITRRRQPAGQPDTDHGGRWKVMDL